MRRWGGKGAEWLEMGFALLRREYPSFVYGRYREGEIPVFTYHAVDSSTFRRDLAYLRENGYKTLVTDEILEILRSGKTWPREAVVLTFDDGLSDLYTTAYPLLREYGFRAIAFIAAYWVGERGVVTWEAIRDLEASGIVDIQSHSYTHAQIPVSAQIDDFFHPALAHRPAWDFPFWDWASGLPVKRPAWGMPIFRAMPALSDRPAVWIDPLSVEAVITHVRQSGGERFFQQQGWKSQLRRFFRRMHSRGVRHETPQEQIRRIRDDLVLGKAELEKWLHPKRVVAFAYPHHCQGKLSARLLREVGYSLVFDGIHPDAGFGDSSQGFFYLKRVHADYIFHLPGKGRRSFPGILWKKARRACSGRKTQ